MGHAGNKRFIDLARAAYMPLFVLFSQKFTGNNSGSLKRKVLK